MKAIFEINGFQKIMDIEKPVHYFDMIFIEPMRIEMADILDTPLRPREFTKITFQFVGQIGQFLLYKYKGKYEFTQRI